MSKVLWRRTLTPRQLARRVARQAGWLARGHGQGEWERLDKSPWWALGGGQPAVNLAFADLTGMDLRGLVLERANLRGVLWGPQDLSGARLEGALLAEGWLAGATFAGADLRKARLDGADLSDCDLSGARLEGARFDQAILEGAQVDWDRVGAGRWRVDLKAAGSAHGDLGESEQDFVQRVIDQKSGTELARYASTYFQNLLNSEYIIYGVQLVEISRDGKFIRVVDESGGETLTPL